MNVDNALKLTCLGVAGGLVLRLVTMLFFYDYDIGFFTDDGMLAWITIIFIAVIWIVALIFCYRDKQYFFGEYVVRRNVFAGLVSLISAITLSVMVVVQTQNHQTYLAQEQVSRDFAQTSTIHIIFIICSALMALLQFAVSISFFSGRNFFTGIPVVHLFRVFWGIINILFVFLYYARSALTTENIYMIFGCITLLFALLYMSKLIVGIGDERTTKRCYAMGIPAVILNITYNLSNLILNLLGREYIDLGEIPLVIQAANLCVSLYVLAFLFTFKNNSLKRKSRTVMKEKEEQQTRQKRYNEN